MRVSTAAGDSARYPFVVGDTVTQQRSESSSDHNRRNNLLLYEA